MTREELSGLIEKYLSGTASPEERERLLTWYRRTSREETVWPADSPGEAERLKERLLDKLSRAAAMTGQKKYRFVHRKKRYLLAAAASLALTVCFFAWFFVGKTPENHLTVSNPAGTVRQIILPDGSSVWLNASSTLRFPEKFGECREVELKGEACFDVKKDPRKPFRVRTPALTVRVLGTLFGVQAYEGTGRVHVVVERGRVRVDDEQHQSIGILGAGQLLEYDTATGKSGIQQVKAASRLAWKEGKLDFRSRNLEEIAGLLEKWYGVTITFDNERLKECRYHATFDNDIPLRELLELLCEINDIRFSIDPERNEVRLGGRGCETLNQHDIYR